VEYTVGAATESQTPKRGAGVGGVAAGTGGAKMGRGRVFPTRRKQWET
jgi:hypothetical protein